MSQQVPGASAGLLAGVQAFGDLPSFGACSLQALPVLFLLLAFPFFDEAKVQGLPSSDSGTLQACPPTVAIE